MYSTHSYHEQKEGREAVDDQYIDKVKGGKASENTGEGDIYKPFSPTMTLKAFYSQPFMNHSLVLNCLHIWIVCQFSVLQQVFIFRSNQSYSPLQTEHSYSHTKPGFCLTMWNS